MLPRALRLRSGGEIREVVKSGQRFSSPLFTLHYLPSETSQFAVITGRVLGNSVVRNRIKRRLLNALRPKLSTELKIKGVFRMRQAAFTASPEEWSDFLDQALKRVSS
ncbi:ribonuclease P protein component [Aquiluna borgnonia]|uniref:Ribonuclease P protein component n=1 Tax=Aquiluna borgnonia TaxID=2499157 RepID=A0A7D4Q5X4_9MICO|nr:ribonuclease P protein component [Aquiluna borgnonia]